MFAPSQTRSPVVEPIGATFLSPIGNLLALPTRDGAPFYETVKLRTGIRLALVNLY